MGKNRENRVSARLRTLGQKAPTVLMELCEVNGDVNVPGGQGYMWARATKRDIPMPILNLYSSAQPGQQVLVGEDPASPGVRQVVGARIYPGGKLKFNPKIAGHRNHHARYGVDPLFIETKQITNCLAYNGGGLKIKVYPGVAQVGTQYVQVGWQTLDLTSYVPASGLVFVLIQIGDTGAASAKAGAGFALADYDLAYIPQSDGASYICAAVRLHAGQTAIKNGYTDPDLIDLRFLNGGGTGSATALRCIWHRSAADGSYKAYDPSDAGLAQVNAVAASGDAITVPEGSYNGFALVAGVRYTCHPDAVFTSSVTFAAGSGWIGGRIEFTASGATDAVGIIGPATSGIVATGVSVKIAASGTGNAYAVKLMGGWVACRDAYLRASAADAGKKARLYYSTTGGQADCNADQCVYAYAATETSVPANWKISEGAIIAVLGCAWPTGYAPDASITYRPGDRSAINHTHAQLHDAVTVSDTATVDLSLSGQAISAAVIPGGIKLDDLGTPDDNTDLNASTSRHGLLLKLDNDAAHYLNGQGAWAIANTRERLTAARTYYVRTDGNDSNTGLANTSGGAFLTIQKAIDVVSGLDINGQTVTIQIGDGTYTAGMTLKNVVGYAAPGNLVIRGNASNHSAVMLNLSSGIPILAENISSVWTLYDFHAQTGSAVCLYASGSGTTIQFSGLDFGTCATNHIQTNNGASVNAIGDYSISASSSYYHIQAVNRSIVVTAGRTVTIAANLTLVTFVLVENLSEILAYGMTFSLGAYSVTGARYTVGSNSVIYTAGGTNYFPGNSAGVAATGGIYT